MDIDNMELGNLFFGNSRGPIQFPDRDLVNCKEWNKLVNELIQVEDYHCILGEYSEHLSHKRTNNLKANKYGGYTCVDDNGKTVFEIFPYYWGDCTCGTDEYNLELEQKLKNKYFTNQELNIIESIEDWCEDDCPASDLNENNINKTDEELESICTCGIRHKNVLMHKQKLKYKDKIDKFNEELNNKTIAHKDDCLLLKHNFIYHPDRPDEFWIDWYKYPFRDAYMNKNKTKKEIKDIWIECQNAVIKDLNRKRKE